jgi:hypothetical protein
LSHQKADDDRGGDHQKARRHGLQFDPHPRERAVRNTFMKHSPLVQAPWRTVLRDIGAISDDTFVGIYDLAYAPYALGDSLTWQENVLVEAIDQGYEKVRLCVVADPDRSSGRQQAYINRGNYNSFLRELYPAFFSNPLSVAVHVFRDRFSFNLLLLDAWRKNIGSWPTYEDHFNEQLDYAGHGQINSFHKKHGYLPRLASPLGYEADVVSFIASNANAYLVTVNIRQSHRAPFPSDLHRDSPIVVWHRFFRAVAGRYPEALFLVVGRYGEWDLELMNHQNVRIMRAYGFNLGHELALVHKTDLFMGTSSGFSTAATFSGTPYIITNMEKQASPLTGVKAGSDRYPFALENQLIHWEPETEEFLLSRFENIYRSACDHRRARQRIRRA